MFPNPELKNHVGGLQSRFQSYNSLDSFKHVRLNRFLNLSTSSFYPVVVMTLIAEDIKNTTKLLGTDLIIAYGLSRIHQYIADDRYRLMGPTGSGKSNVRNVSYKNNFSYFHLI